MSVKPLSPAESGQTSSAKVWWVEFLRWAALAVFVALPAFAYFYRGLAGRVIWTIVVAALPLFIVLVGYHRWRRICPLAFFAQIPVRMRWPGTRRASPWSEKNYYLITSSVFVLSLWLRLIATNGDGHAIFVFLILLSLAALIIGAVYTGKTWCNYICPVSFIEKIYTEPQGLRETANSQCEKCSACKKFCPDINEENGYWKEIGLGPKRVAYFAFPGLVFAFYLYYYLQAGTWEYYFSGRWTNDPGLIGAAFLTGPNPGSTGFFFLPAVPRALAAAITLLLGAITSFLIFSAGERTIERWLRRREAMEPLRARHIMFSVSAFTAFVIFYSFAGQPSLRKLTFFPAPQLMAIIVVLTATAFLLKRLRRTPKDFAEESLARNIIKRWQWPDTKPPKDLREAFLIHTIQSRESVRASANVLQTYEDSVREVLANGFVTREEVHLLEHLRDQLKIKKSDHERIMTSLAEEERALLSDSSKQISAEKRLQLTTYENALKRHLAKVLDADGNADNKFVMRLRSEFAVTRKEHAPVLDELLDENSIAAQLAESLRTIERADLTIKALEFSPSATHDFLADLLRRRHARAVENLMRGLSFTVPGDSTAELRLAFHSPDEAFREIVIERLRTILSPALAERLIRAYRETVLVETSMPTLTDMLAARLQSVDPNVRAVALLALAERGAASAELLEKMSRDENDLVAETAHRLKQRTGSASPDQIRLTTVEKMIAFRAAPTFAAVEPEGLTELARASREDEFPPGAQLCAEGEPGAEVFILLAGEVEVLTKDVAGEKTMSIEQAGGFLGELAVLDPAPRSASLRAGKNGAHVLRLDGEA